MNDKDNERTLLHHNERLLKLLVMKLGKNNKTLDAFHELSTLSSENSLNTRRTLRGKIEKRGILIIKDFLRLSENVKTLLSFIHKDIVKIDEMLGESINRLLITKAETFHLQDHSLKFIIESEKLHMENAIISSYLLRFQLSRKEMECLKCPEINTDFFFVLEKAQNIHNNCQILSDCGGTTSAISIMDDMNFLQETALEFLYRWIQIHCKDIEFPKTAFLLTKAMKHYQNRTILFTNLIEEYSAARRAVMVRLFIDALTKGGANGFPKPIETYVYDRKRYVGDMLAWLRQYIPTEKEYLMLLLKECNITNQDIQNEIHKGLSNITEGVCNILLIRIEHLISSSSSPFELCDTMNLLRYYSKIISHELNDSILGSMLNELSVTTECAFLNSIQNLVQQHLLEKVEAPPPDLSPTSGVYYLLSFTKEILSFDGLNGERKDFILKVIDCIIEPLVRAINLSASKLTTVDMAAYLLNCVDEISNTLSFYEFVDNWLERLRAQADAQLDTLTSEQASFLVANLNLGLIYTILQDTSKVPLSQIPGMDPVNLKCFMEKLENFIRAPGTMALPQITHIMNSIHQEEVLKRSYKVIATIYSQLYCGIHDPKNLYENPNSLMTHTPEYIEKILLSKS